MVTDDDTTLSERLLMAADRISWAGLAKFNAGAWDGDGPVCLIGSLWAVRGVASAGEEVGVVDAALVELHGGGYLSQWNDAPGRTADEVRDLLLEAAARAMEQGR